MTTPSQSRPVPARPDAASSSARRLFAVFTGITVLFIFLQSITAGNFIEDGIPSSAKDTWTNVHGALAYPIMVFALLTAVIAITRLRGHARVPLLSGILFVATVIQWLSGHMISTLGMDWVTPYHVVLAFIIYGLAIVLSTRAAALRRSQM